MGTTREEGLAAVEACITRDGGACDESYIQDSTPAHQVTLDNFQMEIYEVSMTQYVAFLNYLLTIVPAGVRPDLAGCGGRPCLLTTDTEANSAIRFNQGQYEVINPAFNAAHPVMFVTWFGADEYCRAIGRRLPSEAEWERAARGPANSIYPWGPEWVPENANTSRSPGAGENTVDVDAYPTGVSAYGVYNMAGNVSEWVFDFYQENYYALPEAAGPNPKGPVAGTSRVARGGGWDNVPLFARTVHRIAIDPLTPRASVGFRCADDAS
jgi:formylglycine-generating enzyme required for sulfatase activity